MIIKNKPGRFDTNKIVNFSFGDPDAKWDEILSSCPHKVRGVREFLGGTKNIVLGERGSGKSALFKLVAEGKYKFPSIESDNPIKQIIVAIDDDDLSYTAISDLIEERFIDRGTRSNGKYRFFWEIYMLSRVIERIGDEIGWDEEVRTLKEDFGEILGIPKEKKFRIGEILANFRLTAGIKLSQDGAITPSVSVESSNKYDQKKIEISDNQIANVLKRVRQAIKVRSLAVVVLIDKIDDFVVGLEYQEQRKSVQALLDCTQAMRFPELKLKIFLRPDIYKRLDFEKGGYDKISPQVVRLEWSPEDICAFVAKRLLYNYEHLQIKTPDWVSLPADFFDFDPTLQDQIKKLMTTTPTSFPDLFKTTVSVLLLLLRLIKFRFLKGSHSERKTNSLDEASLQIITYIFPSKVPHFTKNCKREDISLKQLFAGHFKLGADNPNPRLVILFLNNVIEEAKEYYEKNPDHACREIKANDAGEFELIKREHILRGYKRTQLIARETVAQLNRNWRSCVLRLFDEVNEPRACSGLSIDFLKRIIGWDKEEEEFRRFIAFFTHVGLLIPENESARFEARTFSLPVMMTTCPN